MEITAANPWICTVRPTYCPMSDAAIQFPQTMLWKRLRIVAEFGGAAAFAAVLAGRYVPRPDERAGVLLCGGNTLAVDFSR